MKSPIIIPAIIFGLLVPIALLAGAWNLLAPAAWCWMPAGRAAWLAVFSIAIMVLASAQENKNQETAQKAPRSARRASAGNLPAEDPQGVGKVSANARSTP